MFLLNYSTVFDPLLQDVRAGAVEISGMKPGDRALDVCCGTGDQVFHYARRGVIAAGIDINPNMIKLAERTKSKLGLTNVSFQVANAANLPFDDNFFDYASISLALHEIERTARDKIISEMKRVVKTKGGLIFVDYQVPLPKNFNSYLFKVGEFIARGDHYKNFRDFLAQGGLAQLLPKNQLGVEKRSYLKRGTIAIVKTRNV